MSWHNSETMKWSHSRGVTPPSLVEYEITRDTEAGALRTQRRVAINNYFFKVNAYEALRTFFNFVRAGDGEQVVLRTTEQNSSR